MYKCNECGREYRYKPEYCDCGNDEFTLVGDYLKVTGNNLHKENIFSMIFFLICILLSIFILSINFNQENVDNNKAEQKENLNKHVDWSLFEEKEDYTRQLNIDNTKIMVKQTEQKRTDKKVKKEADLRKESNRAPKDSYAIQSKKEVKIKAPESRKIEQENKLQLKKELEEYKNGLAKLFFYKIDFSNIIGSGYCEISFNITNSGDIINKKFVKQSANTTLNNAVFYAVNKINKYTLPPKGYVGDTLKLRVDFQNGEYSISVN